MKTYTIVLALLAALISGCPRSSSVDAGTDIGSDIPVGPVTSSDASTDQ